MLIKKWETDCNENRSPFFIHGALAPQKLIIKKVQLFINDMQLLAQSKRVALCISSVFALLV